VANNAAGQPILYAFSGVSDDGEFFWGSHAYNLATDTWTAVGGIGYPYSNGVGRIGNKLYISGGYDFPVFWPAAMLRHLWVYNPLTDRSTRKADMPRATAEGVSGVIDGQLYVLAGTCVAADELVACHSFYRYNPATNTWTKLAPSPRNHQRGAGGVINGKFYVAGGWNGSRLTNKLDVYDPSTNAWSTRASLPEVRGGAAGTVLQNKLYLIGGDGPSGDQAVLAYDPVTNTWKTRASLNAGRHGLAAASLLTRFGNPKILAVGGSGDYTANELYTP
jgi:N-acetylneuraminic acid mutarotase